MRISVRVHTCVRLHICTRKRFKDSILALQRQQRFRMFLFYRSKVKKFITIYIPNNLYLLLFQFFITMGISLKRLWHVTHKTSSIYRYKHIKPYNFTNNLPNSIKCKENNFFKFK
jgi:hypothetical protein